MKLAGQNLYDEILRHFVEKMLGEFLLVSEDRQFLKIIKSCFKYLDIGFEHVHHILDIGETAVHVAELAREHKHLLVIIESQIQGKSTLPLLSQIKELHPSRCSVICATYEINRDKISYLLEMGADNVIVKPVTMNNVIQKIALTIRPNNRMSKLIDGCKKLIGDNKLFEAMRLVDLIFLEKPESTIGFMLKGDIYRRRGDFKNAEGAYLRASHQSRLYLEPLKRLAALYQDISDLDKRLKYLKRLDQLSPLNHDRKIEIGATCLEMNLDLEAKTYFDAAVELVKKQNDEVMSSTLMEIGKKLQERNPISSLNYMAQAISLKEKYLTKDDIWMFNEIGLNYRKNGQSEKALEYYGKALEIAKDDGAIYFNIGMAHAEAGGLGLALENFERAIEKTPDILNYSPQISYNIATVYQKANRLREAEHYYKICLVVDPYFKDAATKVEILSAL